MAGVEGEIQLKVTLGNSRVTSVDIVNQRNLNASRLLVGKSVPDALKIVPLIFSLCGMAQACAAARACEAALGIQVAREVEARRDALVRAETLRELLWRVLIDWPLFLHESMSADYLQTLVRLLNNYRVLISGNIDLFWPGADIDRPVAVNWMADISDFQSRFEAFIQPLLLGCSLDHWQALDSVDQIAAWSQARDSVSARLIHHCLSQQWQGDCASEVEPLPTLESGLLLDAMLEVGFLRQPHWLGAPHETSVTTDYASPAVADCRNRFGNGLLTRMVARLQTIVTLIRQLSCVVVDDNLATRQIARISPLTHVGLSQVSAARGLLVHRVTIAGDRVRDYHILAPTEWNFHPQGTVSRALSALTGTKSEIEQKTRLLINAIDPCVGYRLDIVQPELTHA